MELFCFFLGVLCCYTGHPYLPVTEALIFFVSPRHPILFFFSAGLLFAWGHEWLTAPAGMPPLEVIPEVRIQGTVVSIPLQSPSKTQFIFELDALAGHPAQALVQLAWYNKAALVHAGERWQFSVKLKKPRNFNNPGSSDYVHTLAARHIVWTGSIQAKGPILIQKTRKFPWLQFREHLAHALLRLAPDKQTAGIVQALTLNLTQHISQAQWELFRRTGTTHLFGISGEHIALIFGLTFKILYGFWTKNSRLCTHLPAPYFASSGGFLAALFFAFLAGFGPPVQRALIGCFFYTGYCLGKWRLSPWQTWRYALFGVLVLEPHAVFMQGFYFSFLAVACLLLTQQRWQLEGYKSKLALQLSCLLGLMPLTLHWFSYGSINGFIANLFAIPLVGFFIVPLALLTLLFYPFSLAGLLMKVLAWLINVLLLALSWTQSLSAININWSLNSIEFTCALMGGLALWVLVPEKPFKTIALFWLILPALPNRPLVQPGEALIRVLDVGQGLAVVIQTEKHLLLYDTGDQFFDGNDLGKLVVLPYLKSLHQNKVDAIVISHPDRDHRGGLKSIAQNLAVTQLIVNDPLFYKKGALCHEYPDWEWDGVHFHFFPLHTPAKDRNNSCCVLQISTHIGSVLFTGDIERPAEKELVKNYGSQLKSDVLIVPHHGSKTSSSYRFLLEVAPTYALASLGFDNRFHFPHPQTLANMHALGIEWFETDVCGLIELRLPAQGILKKPQCPEINNKSKSTIIK